jgi:hypothetical protein
MSTPTSDDLEQVRRTVTNVVHFIDFHRWTELREQFADTVETDYTSLFGGEAQRQPGDALIEGWRGLLAPIVTQHLLGPITVDVEGASAIAHCHVRAWHHAPDAPGGDEWMVAGHYVFELANARPTWKIKRMALETFYQTGNEALLQEAAALGD